MTRSARLIAPALAFSLFTFSDAYAQSGRKGVENAVKRMINAANRVNLEGVLAEFAPNVEMLDNGARFANAAALRATYTPVFKGLRKQDVKVERSNISMITPTLAVYTASGTFTATDTLGSTSPRRGFAWTMVWRADSSNWKATSVHQSIASRPTAAVTVSQAGRAGSNDMNAFRDHAKTYEAALNKRDAAAVAALYSANGDLVYVDRPRLQSRNAIRESIQKDLATWPKARQIKLEVTSARLLSPDIAVVETAATFSEGPVRTNRGTSVLVREGSKWLISSLRVYPAQAR